MWRGHTIHTKLDGRHAKVWKGHTNSIPLDTKPCQRIGAFSQSYQICMENVRVWTGPSNPAKFDWTNAKVWQFPNNHIRFDFILIFGG